MAKMNLKSLIDKTEKEYPLNTFYGETKKELIEMLTQAIKDGYALGVREANTIIVMERDRSICHDKWDYGCDQVYYDLVKTKLQSLLKGE